MQQKNRILEPLGHLNRLPCFAHFSHPKAGRVYPPCNAADIHAAFSVWPTYGFLVFSMDCKAIHAALQNSCFFALQISLFWVQYS